SRRLKTAPAHTSRSDPLTMITHPAAASVDAGAPRAVLSARGLTKRFGPFLAVKDVDIDVCHGRIHALIGPNGAGKSTVFNLLTKFLKPTTGRIVLDGVDITAMDPASVDRIGMARTVQILAYLDVLTLLDNVRCATQRLI